MSQCSPQSVQIGTSEFVGALQQSLTQSKSSLYLSIINALHIFHPLYRTSFRFLIHFR